MEYNKDPNSSPNKKDYCTPKIVVLGSVNTMTQQNGGSTTPDAGNSPHRAISGA
jgi:hypothetical protein